MNRFLIILLFLFPSLVFSQPRFETGIQLSGGWVFPGKASPVSNYKNGFSSGIDAYVAYHLWKPVYIISGVGYQYKEMQDLNEYSSGSGRGYGDGTTSTSIWEKFPHHYIRIPLRVKLSTRKGFFVQSGIEAGWLLNYDSENENPEYNWAVGLGNRKHKLGWSLEYIQGFEDQGFGEQDGDHIRATIYRNREIRLNFFYPLFSK